MATAYARAMKMMEGMVGQFDGLVTLPKIADVYEALGRFLKDLNLLSEVMHCIRINEAPCSKINYVNH